MTSTQNSLRVAIVGAGPSGMYAADALCKAKIDCQIDIFDRLPTPYGLLRGGVAPDHQKMKSLESFYDRIFTKNDNVAFYGNVAIGTDLNIQTLKTYYDAIVIACGAESDRQLNIDGEDLAGSFAATEFVGWYNGHPDYQNRQFNFSGKSVAIIGQGNVAIDVCRILAKTPAELADSDIAQHALDALADSKITDIHLIGRRGPVQAAFTKLEIKELGELAECDVVVNKADLNLGASCQSELEESNKAQKNVEILTEFAGRPTGTKSKRIHIHFFKSPIAISGTDNVTSITLGTNTLSGEPNAQRASDTGERAELTVDMIFRSVGYRGTGLKDVPFDEKRGVIPNQDGQVVDTEGKEMNGCFVVGWIKRGPSGVLGTNKPDSQKTIDTLLAKRDQLEEAPMRDTDHLLKLLTAKGVRVVTFEDWKKIDAVEKETGQKVGKPREKFISVADMLAVID